MTTYRSNHAPETARVTVNTNTAHKGVRISVQAPDDAVTLSPADARALAADLTRLADAVERPEPGDHVIYRKSYSPRKLLAKVSIDGADYGIVTATAPFNTARPASVLPLSELTKVT